MSEVRPHTRLVRHGETAWSKSGQHTSRTDLPLTPVGERQAKALGGALAEQPSPLVLTSPLQRATRTAELAGLLPYEICEDLREWDYGDLEGRTTDDIRQDYPGWTIWTGPWPGGESPAAVGARCDRIVSRLLQEPSGATVTVVAHGHILRVLAARWLGADVSCGGWLALDTATVSWLGGARVPDHRWLEPPAPSRCARAQLTMTGPPGGWPPPPPCYRHPGRPAAVACPGCSRPVCAECLCQMPAGWACDDCARSIVPDRARAAARSDVPPPPAAGPGIQSPATRPGTQPPPPPGAYPPARYRSPARRRPGRQGRLGATRMTPVVAGLIAVNVIVYILESLHRVNVITRFALFPIAVHDQHQWYRLITAAFLHANLTHIAFNMITLAIVGPAVEATIGHVRFAFLYLLAALGGSVASYLLSSPFIYGVGASGAIFGLMGAYFVLARRHGWETTTISALIVINLVLSFTSGIDWRAHLGGLVTGALVALGMQAAAERRGNIAWAGAVLTVAVALAVLAGLTQLAPGHVNLS